MSIETILWIAGVVVLLIIVPTIGNLIQKQKIQGHFINIKDDTADESYATILLNTTEGEKEIIIYKSCLQRMQEGQFISVIKRKFESIYSLNWIMGEK